MFDTPRASALSGNRKWARWLSVLRESSFALLLRRTVTCRVFSAPPPLPASPGCLGVPVEGLSSGLGPWLSSAPAHGVIPSCPHPRGHRTQQRREVGRVHVPGFDKTPLCPHHVRVNVPAAAMRGLFAKLALPPPPAAGLAPPSDPAHRPVTGGLLRAQR